MYYSLIILLINAMQSDLLTLNKPLERWKSSIFWDIKVCTPLKDNWCFRRTCHLYLQGWREARNQQEPNRKQTSVNKNLVQVSPWFSYIACTCSLFKDILVKTISPGTLNSCFSSWGSCHSIIHNSSNFVFQPHMEFINLIPHKLYCLNLTGYWFLWVFYFLFGYLAITYSFMSSELVLCIMMNFKTRLSGSPSFKACNTTGLNVSWRLPLQLNRLV
jgi:hypothetical protein